MTPLSVREAWQAAILLESYSFELLRYGPREQIARWQQVYGAMWIRDAVIEALFQGRYKVVSVEKILRLWQRRGQPVRHFTSEFKHTIGLQLGSPMGVSLPASKVTAAAPMSLPAPPYPRAAELHGAMSAEAPESNTEGTIAAQPRFSRRLSLAYRSAMPSLAAVSRPIQPFQPALPLHL